MPGGAGALRGRRGGQGRSRRPRSADRRGRTTAGRRDWSNGLAAVADLEEMTRMWAVERYIGHWDGYAGRAPRPAQQLLPLQRRARAASRCCPGAPTRPGTNACRSISRRVAVRPVPRRRELRRSRLPGKRCGRHGTRSAAWASTRARRRHRRPARRPGRRSTRGGSSSSAEIATAVAETRAFIAARPGEASEWLAAHGSGSPGASGGQSRGPRRASDALRTRLGGAGRAADQAPPAGNRRGDAKGEGQTGDGPRTVCSIRGAQACPARA